MPMPLKNEFLYVFLKLVEFVWLLYRHPVEGLTLAAVFLAILSSLYYVVRMTERRPVKKEESR